MSETPLKTWLKKNWIALTIGILIFGSILKIAENKGWIEPTNPEQVKKEPVIAQEIDLPDYSLLDEEISDTALKTQVKQYLHVSGNITKESLENLLVKVYEENLSRTGFKNYTHPNSIYIYAYTDKDHLEGSTDAWIAMLGKSKVDKTYSIEIIDRLISALDYKPEKKFGFSEEERKEIFKEIVSAENRGDKDAEAKYPFLDPLKPDYSDELALAEANKQMEYTQELQKVYKSEVLAKYSIDEAIAKEIINEALTKNWPLPKY